MPTFKVLALLAWPALQAQLLLLGVLSALWNLLALVLYPLLPRAQGLRVGRAMISLGYRFYWWLASASGMIKLDAQVLDGLRHQRGLVIVANHPSMLDAVMLVARLPHSFCIMKASLAHNPLLGPGARLARYVGNQSAHSMVLAAVQELQAGGQLVLFPEGTRTVQAPLNPFQASFAMIAKRAQVPVQAVFIDTDSPYLGKGWPLWRLPPLPIRFVVRLGQRFDPPTDHLALLQAVHRHFVAEVHVPVHLRSAAVQKLTPQSHEQA
jgi:1-acyl-sn-glycerol-3-phosphate acyltransferase